MKLGLSPVLEVEAAIIYESGATQPIAGQVFYIMDRSAADILKKDEEEAMDALRSEAIDFFVTDSKGKAEVKGLETGIYFICGISQMSEEVAVWNVRIDLQPGKNSLVLDNKNMAVRQKS